MHHMRRSGRINVIAIFAVVAVAMLAVVLIFSKQSLSNAGGQFMDALARGDVDKLTELSQVSGENSDQIRKQWEFATQVAGKNYSFRWRITSESEIDSNDGTVKLSVTRNAASPSSYEENYALPMVKVNGLWKVDVANVSREMYPGMPKASAS
jgi:hypothetical protein